MRPAWQGLREGSGALGTGGAPRTRALCRGPGPPPQAASDPLSLAVDHLAFYEILSQWTRAASILTFPPLPRAPSCGDHPCCCVYPSLAFSCGCVDFASISPVVGPFARGLGCFLFWAVGNVCVCVCLCVDACCESAGESPGSRTAGPYGVPPVQVLFVSFSGVLPFDEQLFDVLCQLYP